ncbi:MAG: transglycosylase SLT domain-containing protein [Prevotella sp.]|nr:transglycosylase SLT domain-containing protein [Prevotella sp.]MBR7048568.1 transglycosylase SLT domain-containing protein [Prevotella sp.]
MQAQSYEDYEIVTDEQGQQQEIGLPESMTVDIDDLLDQYHTKAYMQTNACNYRNDDPETEKEEYIERLQQIPAVMEMVYNEPVQKMIDRYTKRGRRQVSYMLGAANFYMPIFEQALETYGLPLELKYLPVIESALNPKAVSRVGATGLWQFMLETGKRYGLKVNSLVDERRDPVKASDAAARYLRDLYKIFGDWNLVIASYNAGPERINKAIHRAGGETDYWKIYPYLPKETRGYVPAFIAANYVMTYYCDHNICPMETDLPAKSDTILVDRDIHLSQIANVIDIDLDLLKELNPQYRKDLINGRSGLTDVRLPAQYLGVFIDMQDSICNYNADQLIAKRAEVAIEESSAPTKSSSYRSSRSYSDNNSYSRSSRSSRHRESYATTYNSKGKGRHKGREEKEERGKGKGKKKKGRNAEPSAVTVQKGESLDKIAKKNHTTVKELKKKNNIKGDKIKPGQKIKVK